jgi:tRNA-2-methylthio-N6-dimethylallyladenosine synthase
MDILKAMRRGYTVDRYLKLIEEIRTKIPEIALSTDVIVGFPGETPEQFQNTFNLLAQTKFDMVHVAAYSPREGTLAAREMQDDVPSEVKKERLTKIEKLQAGIIDKINERMQDQIVEVLVEGKEKGKWTGGQGEIRWYFFSDQGDCQSLLVRLKLHIPVPGLYEGN